MNNRSSGATYVRGHSGRLLVATHEVALISGFIGGQSAVVIALKEFFCTENIPFANVGANVHFDAVRDLETHFGSFWKAIVVWMGQKSKSNDLHDWIHHTLRYDAMKEGIQDLIDSSLQAIEDCLEIEPQLQGGCGLFQHDTRVSQEDELPVVSFYVELILERHSSINPFQAHSFLQKNTHLRNQLKTAGYQLSDLTPFFQKHHAYFIVDSGHVSIQPIYFVQGKKVLYNINKCAMGVPFVNDTSSEKSGSSILDFQEVKRNKRKPCLGVVRDCKHERKAIFFFSAKICEKFKAQTPLTLDQAAGLLQTGATEEMTDYLTRKYGHDLNLFFLQYPQCFHITKGRNIFLKPFKKIQEFVNSYEFLTPLAQSRTEILGPSPYLKDNCSSEFSFKSQTPESSCYSPIPDFVTTDSQELGYESESPPEVQFIDAACQTMSTGSILSLNVYSA